MVNRDGKDKYKWWHTCIGFEAAHFLRSFDPQILLLRHQRISSRYQRLYIPKWMMSLFEYQIQKKIFYRIRRKVFFIRWLGYLFAASVKRWIAHRELEAKKKMEVMRLEISSITTGLTNFDSRSPSNGKRILPSRVAFSRWMRDAMLFVLTFSLAHSYERSSSSVCLSYCKFVV